MKVVLKQDVKGLGKKGQLVNASDGYARNFLFPKNLAVEANAENMSKLKAQNEATQFKKDTEKLTAKLKNILELCRFTARLLKKYATVANNLGLSSYNKIMSVRSLVNWTQFMLKEMDIPLSISLFPSVSSILKKYTPLV